MPWDDTACNQHSRDGLRYPSDLTDREWGLIEPLLPAARPGGWPRTTDMRAVVEAILYMAASGCQWRMLPKDFPPVSPVQGYFYDWRNAGLWQTINHLLVMSTRELEGREASPTAGVIDSQSVKTTESGGVCGYDAGKKIKGRRRHIVTDTLGLMLVRCHPYCRYPGPRRGARGAQIHPLQVPMAASRLCRWRLCRAKAAYGAQGARRLEHRDHQALRHCQRF